jgi:hypothetical protein
MSQKVPDSSQPQTVDENFLQRWSRLKATAREADPSGTATDDMVANSAAPVSADATGQPTEPVTPVEAPPLPDLDQLDQDSDYSAFLAPHVDAALRRKALRKLFHSPKFNVCDGLDDYCDDFTRFSPLGADVVTADMKHHMERAARKLAEQLETPAAPEPTTAGAPISTEAACNPEQSPSANGAREDDDHRPA